MAGARMAAAWVLLATTIQGCAGSRAHEWAAVREVTPEFLLKLEAYDPALASDSHGRVALTYVTNDSGATDLWLAISRDGGVSFEPPRRVNTRPGAVSSFPEGRPMAAWGPAAQLVVAWVEESPQSRAADLMVSSSGDGGANLTAPVAVNDDIANPKRRYHGFHSVTFLPDGRLFAAWMDERDLPPSDGEPPYASLYGASSVDGGQQWSRNRRLTEWMCPCCRPDVKADSAGNVVVAYRTAEHDLRDPMLLVSRDGGRSFAPPSTVSNDGWKLSGCPAVGPSLAGFEGGGQCAWYTGAEDPGVFLAPWSAAHGVSGVKRGLGDGLLRASHPRIARWGNATLISIEAIPESDSTRQTIAVRRLDADGSLGPWMFLGVDGQSSWVSPVDAASALVCWVEGQGDESRVRVARLTARSKSR